MRAEVLDWTCGMEPLEKGENGGQQGDDRLLGRQVAIKCAVDKRRWLRILREPAQDVNRGKRRRIK